MNEFKGKSVLIAAPNHYGILNRFKDNLEAIGFNVVIIPDDLKVKIGFRNSLIHVFKKLFKGDSSFKKDKKIELRAKQQILLLKSQTIEKFDYSLFIRPDLFSASLLSFIKGKTNSMCAYQWDGLDRFPKVYDKISFFDKFYVFDEDDLKKRKEFLFTTNFYFDDIIPSQENNIDAYFVGSYMENRISTLLELSKKLKKLGLKTSINLSMKSIEKKKINTRYITPIKKPISFEENIVNSSKSKIIIDLTNGIHSGLSMRIFESIGFKKKLITNNQLVKKYEFYNLNNIFLIENDKLDGIEEFINTPYQDLNEEVYEKYSFTNWIKKILDI